MAYTWQWYDRNSGELHVVKEQDDPCVCTGQDLPHPPDLCARVFAKMDAQRAAVLAAGQ